MQLHLQEQQQQQQQQQFTVKNINPILKLGKIINKLEQSVAPASNYVKPATIAPTTSVAQTTTVAQQHNNKTSMQKMLKFLSSKDIQV